MTTLVIDESSLRAVRVDKKPGHHVVAFAFVLLPNRVSV